ncbi:THA1 aldolase, partial [Orthonyx spaldingii]|nr:THA1 aldolase [Orthonyx spaldingii]
LTNAAVAQGVEPAQIAQHCDSVSLCFSKGLGAPSAAVWAGCREFVTAAWHVWMRQVGVLAAAAHLGALQKLPQGPLVWLGSGLAPPRPPTGVHVLDSPLWSIRLAVVETNIVMANVQGSWPSPAELCDHLRAVSEEEVAETEQAVSILLLTWPAETVRAVWHRNISAHDTELARRTPEFVARKFQE